MMTLTPRPRPTVCALGALAAVLLLVLSGLATPAGEARAAADLPKLGIRPADGDQPYLALTLKPGKHRTLAVELANGGSAPERARTYAADAYTLVNGGFGARLDGEPTSGPTTWLTYPRADLDLTPNQPVRRAVTVAVPKGTPPGEYVTALVVQNAHPIAGSGAIAVDQVLRQAIAIAVTVPGPRTPRLEIGAATYWQIGPAVSLRVAVANTGNVHLKPRGELVLTDGAGRERLRVPPAMDTVYAGTATAIEVPLPQPLPAGAYTVALALTDAQAGASAQAPDLPLSVPAGDAVGTPSATPAPGIAAVTVEAVRDRTSGAVQYADIAVAVANPGAPIANGRLALQVTRDGQPVEDYVLAAPLALASGAAQVQQRYLPASGWSSGTYAFAVTLERVDPATGAATVLATAAAAAPLVVG